MKQNLFGLMLFSIFYISCGNPCDDLNCGPNGVCDEATEACICDNWYEGTLCETETRAVFLGSWASTSNCNLGNGVSDPDITITPGLEIDEIIIQSPDILANRAIVANLTSGTAATIVDFESGITSFSGSISYADSTTMFMTMDVVNNEQFQCLYSLTR